MLKHVVSSPELLVGQVQEPLGHEQLEQILHLGMANYLDAFRIDIAGAPQGHLEKAKLAWELELSNRLSALQHHASVGTDRPPVTVILAQDGSSGQVAGFLLAEQLNDTCDCCEIRFVVVHEGYRQRGLLGKMIRALSSSYSLIKLDCKEERYFTSSGFVVTGELGKHKLMQLGALLENGRRVPTTEPCGDDTDSIRGLASPRYP